MKKTAVFLLITLCTCLLLSFNPKSNAQSGPRTNSIWCHYADLDAQFWTDLTDGNIDQAYIDTGQWNGDHTIEYFLSQSQINNFVGSAHINGIEAIAWVHYRYPEDYYKIDVRGATNQTAMANSVISCLAKGFDGFEDDLEPYDWAGETVNIIGNYDDYISYLNVIGAAAHGVGKTCYAALNIGYNNPAVDDIIDQVTELDGFKCMLYNGGTYSQSEMHDVLGTVLNVPPNVELICGLITPLANPLNYIDNIKPSLPTFNTYVMGYGLFEYSTMSGTDWSNWDSWTTKNDYPGEPTPSPAPTPTPSPYPQPTPTPYLPPGQPTPTGSPYYYREDTELDTVLFLSGGVAVLVLAVTLMVQNKGKGKTK